MVYCSDDAAAACSNTLASLDANEGPGNGHPIRFTAVPPGGVVLIYNKDYFTYNKNYLFLSFRV
jgi:hypothetical protein